MPDIPDLREIEAYFDRLYPLMRSITGEGVRRTHDILGEIMPLQRHEVASGTDVFDWKVPPEWVVREAYIVTPSGHRICDIQDHNLHLLNYSVPFRGRVTRQELEAHLYSLPDQPDAIPYVTSYYQPRWGFCLPHELRAQLPDGDYDIVIDTELKDGALTYSQALLPGASEREVLISSYTCHPSMANNELSGPLVAAFLYRELEKLKDRRLTYRFVLIPETIGAITYLSRNGMHLKDQMIAGYVLTCIGDRAGFTYKKSRKGNTLGDAAAQRVLSRLAGANIIDFFPNGSDERQYCSPGFDLPVGVMARSWPATFTQYHTSRDDKAFISFARLAEAVRVMADICRELDQARIFQSLYPYGEPQLGKRDMISTVGAQTGQASRHKALKWFLNLADGEHDLAMIAARSGLDIGDVEAAAELCLEKNLVKEI